MKKSHEHYFKDTWDEYLKKFSVIFKTSLLLQLLPMILGTIIIGIAAALFIVGVGSGFSESTLSSLQSPQEFFELIFKGISFAAIIPAAIIITLAALAIFVFFMLSSIAHIKIALSEEKEVTFEEALNFAKKNFWSYLGLAIVMNILLALLFLLLIIPGIIFLVYWVLAPYILLNEKKTISESLQESKNRVGKKWWPVFFHLLGGYLIIMCASGLLTSILPLLGNLFLMIVAMPILLIFLKNIYRGLSRKEAKQSTKPQKKKPSKKK